MSKITYSVSICANHNKYLLGIDKRCQIGGGGPQIGVARRIVSMMAPVTGTLGRRVLVIGVSTRPMVMFVVMSPVASGRCIPLMLFAGIVMVGSHVWINRVRHGG